MQRIALLGCTGSIGSTTLRVLARHRDQFEVVALVAGSQEDALAAQVAEWRPAYAGLVRGAGSNGSHIVRGRQDGGNGATEH